MLAYAAHRRAIAGRRPAPHALLVIVVGHIALIAAVMSARMDLPERIFHRPTVVTPIPIPVPPPPEPQPRAEPQATNSAPSPVPPLVPIAQPSNDPIIASQVPAQPGPIIGPAVIPQPSPVPLPQPPVVRVGPRFATPPSAVRPPYPPSKIASGEEASLKLRLSIDERGRVVAVEPVGNADPAFLSAARRHLLARWRYRPATEGGRAIASSTVISLRFELDD